MSFLTIKAVPTKEEGIFYNPNFVHDDIFPEVVAQRKALFEKMDEIDPEGERPRSELVQEVDRSLVTPPIEQGERAKRLLQHAFCNEDGSPLAFNAEGKLSDYVVAKTNDLYDSTMKEISDEGKRSLGIATDNSSATS